MRSSRGDVLSFAKYFIMCGNSTAVFRVINSGGVFLLSVSAEIFFCFQTKWRLRNFIDNN